MTHQGVRQVVDDQVGAAGEGGRGVGRARSRCPSAARWWRPARCAPGRPGRRSVDRSRSGRRPGRRCRSWSRRCRARPGRRRPPRHRPGTRSSRTAASRSGSDRGGWWRRRDRSGRPGSRWRSHGAPAAGSAPKPRAPARCRRRPRAARRCRWHPGRGPGGPAPARGAPIRTSTSTPCSRAAAMCCRSGIRSAGPCSQSIRTKSKPLTATISTSSSAGIRSSTPSSFSPLAGPRSSDDITPPSPPTGRCRRPQSPGIASMASTAEPTSVSVTIRPRAARETKVSTASAYVRPERSASSRKLRSIRGPSTGPGDRLLTLTPAVRPRRPASR